MALKKTSVLHYGYIDDAHAYTCVLMLERMTQRPWAHTLSYHKVATLQCPELSIVLHHKTHPWIRNATPINEIYTHATKALQDANVQFHAPRIVAAQTHAIAQAVAEGLEIKVKTQPVNYYDEPRQPAEWMRADSHMMPYRTWTLADLTS